MSVNSALYNVHDALLDLIPFGQGITRERSHTSLLSDGGLGIFPTALGPRRIGEGRWQCVASLLTDSEESLRMGGRQRLRWAVTGLALPLPRDRTEVPFFEEDGTGTIVTKPWRAAAPPARLAEAWQACLDAGWSLSGLRRPAEDR